MKRSVLAALVFSLFMPAICSAVEITNIRPCYGAIGATRYDKKLLPGDVMYMTYDIGGLALDPKTGQVNYSATVELLDAQGKVLFTKETPNQTLPDLGGATMPGDVYLETAIKQAPGNYTVRVTVEDKIGKNAKAFKYDFEVLPPSFGMIGIMAPAFGLPRQPYVPGCVLINLGLDAKNQPNVEVTFRILDKDGKKVANDVQKSYPLELPAGSDLSKANFVPMEFPVFLNRIGRFTVEIIAEDKISKKKTELRYPFTVIDVGTFTGR